MSDEAKSNVNLGNDVQLIRNILVGEHLEKFQEQLDALEKEVSALKKENKALRKEYEAENDKQIQELIARTKQMENEQAEVDNTLRKDFDAQFREFSKRLLENEGKQGDLIRSLAEALLEYTEKSGK